MEQSIPFFEIRIKAIELNQQNIVRMAQNSFQVKGFFVTVLSAIVTISFQSIIGASCRTKVLFSIFILLLTFFCWMMDSRYLVLEKMFREHSLKILEGNVSSEIMIFDFNPRPYRKAVIARKCWFSFPSSVYFLGLCVAPILILIN